MMTQGHIGLSFKVASSILMSFLGESKRKFIPTYAVKEKEQAFSEQASFLQSKVS